MDEWLAGCKKKKKRWRHILKKKFKSEETWRGMTEEENKILNNRQTAMELSIHAYVIILTSNHIIVTFI